MQGAHDTVTGNEDNTVYTVEKAGSGESKSI